MWWCGVGQAVHTVHNISKDCSAFKACHLITQWHSTTSSKTWGLNFPGVYCPCKMEHHSTVIWPREHFFLLTSLEIERNMGECLDHQGLFPGFVKDHIHITVSARVRRRVKMWLSQRQTAHTGRVPSMARMWLLQHQDCHNIYGGTHNEPM
jgi:hypothetical protein